MLRIWKRLRQKISSPRPNPVEEAEVERLRLDFKTRYHNFKLLLAANNRCLEVMAQIEAVLQEGRPFGMSLVRACSTSVSVSVFRMIRHLLELAPGRYDALLERHETIRSEIDARLKSRREIADERLAIPLSAITSEMVDLAGTKMANLGEIRNRLGLRVPDGFVITALAAQRLLEANQLQTEIDRRFQGVDGDQIEALHGLSADIQQLILRAEIPAELAAAIDDAWRQLEPSAGGQPFTVALRSSAQGEDEAGSSFAGQYRSELNIDRDALLQAYKEVLASKYSLQAITYRLNRGFRDEDVSMSVGCMAMVNAVVGGVTYSRSPLDSCDEAIFINASWGLPKAVVDGSVACDLFVVQRTPQLAIRQTEVADKTLQYLPLPEEGIQRAPVSETLRRQPCLEPAQVLQLAEMAMALDAHYGGAQDIEWGIDAQGRIHILQCRPLHQDACYVAQPQSESSANPSLEQQLIVRGGVTASGGVASGPVYLADRAVDVLHFPQGAVLVTSQALPRWAPLLSRAAAVVTEQGGFAGHLANVAREFEVPALFGLEGVTGQLQNGQAITVNASGRALYRGAHVLQAAAGAAPPRRNLMAGSPVYQLLSEVSRLIVPLNLTDPDADGFKPENCQTLHDITRFIHEKSVQEMFSFGREHHFSERSSKQLHYRVPMQWWVLNLDDGFQTEVKGRYIKLSQIASIPMLAFWRGFIAIRWEGPPAIDGKGLMSVMFQSTANPALTPGVKSAFAERNYFMISKHFCNLSSRLGYHFSTLEALIGPRSAENYIRFSFKGGAADLERRRRRVAFIGDLLQELGFSIESREDMLVSRYEDMPQAQMERQMEILGYLTLHTRQLDMIMSNPAAVGHYREKFRQDIARLHAIQAEARGAAEP